MGANHSTTARRFLVAALATAPLAARAETVSPSAVPQAFVSDPLGMLSPKPFAQTGPIKPNRDFSGLPVAGWMLYPSLFAGIAFDDNLFQSATNRTRATGLRLRPAVIADRRDGTHQSSLYINGDFRLFPAQSRGNVEEVHLGGSHTWEATRDFVLRAKADFSRRTDSYSSGSVSDGKGGLTQQTAPLFYDQFTGSVAAVKHFNGMWIGISQSEVVTTYEKMGTAVGPVSQSYRNGVVHSTTGRLGYNISPLLYAFAESTLNFRRFNSGLLNSNGYRFVGGLGTDRISLFRGEVYGGFQRQNFDNPAFRDASSPVVGTALNWYPTQYLDFRASLDETFQDSSSSAVGTGSGGPSKVVSAALVANYRLARSWSASVRGGLDSVSYIAGSRRDKRWSTGVFVNYEIARNLAATLEYSYTHVVSNTAGASFDRNQISAGVTYKY
jgi:hypothetical protein